MKFSLCLSGYEEDFEILPKLEELNVGIELQSYGLKGVDSPSAWEDKIKQHKRVIENFKGRISVHAPFVGIRQTHRDHLLKEAVKKRMQMTFEMAKELKPGTSALFLVPHGKDTSKIFPELEKLKGNIISTSLAHTDEEKLKRILKNIYTS